MKRFFLIVAPAITILILVIAVPFAITHAEVSIFENPIKSDNLADLIQSVVDQLFPFAITIIAVLIMIYGFRYVLYSGTQNQAGLTKLKGLALPLLIGAAVVAGSKVIVEAVRLFAQGFK